MDRLGIEMLSVFGMPPIEFVQLVAHLGCRYITTGMVGFTPLKALDYQPYSLRDDPRLRQDLLAAMEDHDVSISLGEGLLIAPGVDVRSYADDLDIMAELRIPRINTVSLEPDRGRTFDELAALTALAAERGIATCVEPVVGLSIADLPSALAAVEYVDRDEISLLVDTMHVARFGATADDLWSIPAQRIGYIQLSDTTLQPRMKIYAEEAMYERMAPGEGELPLADMLAALPDDRVVGLEVPMRSRAEAGVSAYDRLLPCVNTARALLAGARETR
jgi:sugar phosphate isomerase/epimerase